eukprot:4850654-Pyramimonas_sp.AAC.1
MGPPAVCAVPNWVRRCHADATTMAFGGAPHGATNRVRGVPNWVRWCHADATTQPLGPSVELPMGARTV